MIETALMLPILLMLTFGGIEYGYLFFVKHTLQGAAREGARAAISPNATNADVTRRIAEALEAAGLQASKTTLDPKFTLTLDPANVAAPSGTTLKIDVSSTWGQIGLRVSPPLIRIPATNVIAGAAVMRKEGPVD